MKEKLFSVTKDDLIIQTFRSGGKGGQHQNKTSSGVRIKHPPSGAVAESREERSQYKNKQIAFKRLVNTKEFKTWIRIEAARKTGILDEINKKVEDAINPNNLTVEAYSTKLKKWTSYDEYYSNA